MRRLMAQPEDLRSARELVAFITAQDWGVVDANTRLIALHETNAAITRLRERMNEKEPISDPLPGEPPNAFRMIRETIDKFPATNRKANPGVVPE
jgi:hypothetical protein